MLLTILLLSLGLGLCYTDANQDTEGLENLVEKLQFRLRDMETRMRDEKEKMEVRLEEMEMKLKNENEKLAKEKKGMGRRLENLEDKMKEEKDTLERRTETSTSNLRMEVEEPLRKEMASNYSHNNVLTNPSLRDLPIVLISAWRSNSLRSPQTVTFESFLANYNNGDRPGGGSGELDLDSGVFTCFTPGYYTVSFTAYGQVGPHHIPQDLFLYKNGAKLSESRWFIATNHALNDQVGVTGSRILVSRLLEMFG